MNISNEQQQAIKEAAKEKYGTDIYLWAQQREGFILGAEEVLNNTEKYGLVNWQRGGNTVVSTLEYNKIKESLTDKQATINEHNELLGSLLAELWSGASTETVNDIIQDFIRLKNKF